VGLGGGGCGWSSDPSRRLREPLFRRVGFRGNVQVQPRPRELGLSEVTREYPGGQQPGAGKEAQRELDSSAVAIRVSLIQPISVVHSNTRPLGYQAGVARISSWFLCRSQAKAPLASQPAPQDRRVEVRTKSVCCDVRRLSNIRRIVAKEQTHLMTTCMQPLFWSGT